MPQKGHMPEEIVATMQVDILLLRGNPIGEAVRSIGMTELTYYRWPKEFAV